MKFILPLILVYSTLTFSQKKNEDIINKQLDSLLNQNYKNIEAGATALVAIDGRVVFQKAYGLAQLELNVPMEIDNVFLIGSITKQFTSVAILQLLEKGKLKLEDEIQKYVPDYPTHPVKITIENLLTQTSGIPNYTMMEDYQSRMGLTLAPLEMIDHFKDLPLNFEPGTKWEYSNSNYFLLGYIIEIVSGQTYSDYVKKNVFKLAGMERSYYVDDEIIIPKLVDGYSTDDGNLIRAPFLSMTQPYAAGSLATTTTDLLVWNNALLQGKLINPEYLKKAFTEYTLPNGKTTGYGYGWRVGKVYDDISIWHAGGINGFISMEVYLPEKNIFVTILSNCECNSPVDIALQLASIAAGKDLNLSGKEPETTNLVEFQGVYENVSNQFIIVTENKGRLNSQVGRGPKSELKYSDKDSFFLNSWEGFVFVRNEKGKITELITQNLTGNQNWIKKTSEIPNEDGIHINEEILETYTGTYEVDANFSFHVLLQDGKLYLQASNEEPLEMFASTEDKFFLKVNDAEFEFLKDSQGKINRVLLNQGGREAVANKVYKD